MRMRLKTFKFIAEAFSLPKTHLQMMNEASTVFVDTQNISAGKCQDVLSMSRKQDQCFKFAIKSTQRL